jgi:hypothetical protein
MKLKQESVFVCSRKNKSEKAVQNRLAKKKLAQDTNIFILPT